MIYIDKGEVNQFALTLSESATISNPTYLFKFTWEMNETLAPVYFVGNDLSPYPNRYNLFELEEGVDATFNIGQYRYEVYETFNSNPTDETGLDKVEEGRMVVDGISNSIYE
jgi:hypothetical protein